MEGDQMAINQGEDDQDLLDLPPGFRFHPTDEEIITHYLAKKVVDHRFSACAMGEADLNKCEPWDLPKRAKMGENEWYFFVQKDKKYPTGMRTNRATESGYWKATGKDKEIFRGKSSLVGMRKTLVFYKGRAPKGEKTNWVMHEFRLDGKLAYYYLSKPSKDEWVVCKVFHKSAGIRKDPIVTAADVLRIDSSRDFLGDSIPPLVEPINYYSSSSFTHGEEDHDRDDGIGNHFCLPSGATMIDPNCGGNFTGPQFSEYEFPSSLFSSYLHRPQNSDYFLGYGGADNPRHTIIRGPAAEKSSKPEPFSSIVSPSQDTVVSTDANKEITSCAISGYQYQASGHYAYDDPEAIGLSDFGHPGIYMGLGVNYYNYD